MGCSDSKSSQTSGSSNAPQQQPANEEANGGGDASATQQVETSDPQPTAADAQPDENERAEEN